MDNPKGYALEREGKQEWEFLRKKLNEEKKLGRVSDGQKLTDAIGKIKVKIDGENVDTPDYFAIGRFLNNKTPNPSHAMIEYFYQFLFNVGRKKFWEDSNLVSIYSDFEISLNGPLKIEELKQELEEVRSKLRDGGILEAQAPTSLLNSIKHWYIASLILSMGLVVLGNLYFHKAKKLDATRAFFNTKEVTKKDKLVEEMDFLDSNRHSTFLGFVDTLVRTLMVQDSSYYNSTDLNKICYHNLPIDSADDVYEKHGVGYNAQQLSVFQIRGDSLNSYDHVKYASSFLISKFREVKLREKPHAVDTTLLPKMLGIYDKDYDSDIIFVGYKDTKNEFMFRYPRYVLPNSPYDMSTRQWWLEAVKADTSDKSVQRWLHKFNGIVMDCGVTKPYATYRPNTNTPIHRAFWVSIPMPVDSAKMVLVIDLFMKN